MNNWQSCCELLDLYGVDRRTYGGAYFAQLLTRGLALREVSDYTVRDYAAGVRKEIALSPLVYASIMKRACWAFYEASDAELKEMGLRPFSSVYDLAEAILDATPEKPDALDIAAAQGCAELLRKYGIRPSRAR